MSASQDKRKRQAERAEGLDKRTLAEREAEQKKKKERIRWTAITALILVFALVIVLLNTNLFYTGTTAVSLGDYSITNAEYQYYYNTAYSNFAYNNANILSAFINASEPLDKQAFAGSFLSMFGVYVPASLLGEDAPTDATWADYFHEVAMENIVRITALYDAAVKAGYTLSEEDAAAIETQLASFDSAAASNGLRNGDAYAAYIYGKGVSKATVREHMTRSYIASAYNADTYDGYSYTDEELAAYYEAHRDQLDALSYAYYLVAAERVESTEIVTDEETGEETEQTSEAVTEETMAAAKELAERIMTAARTGEEEQAMSFSEAVAEVSDGEATVCDNYPAYYSASLGEDLSAWLLDTARSEGDMTVIEAKDNGYYVLRFEGRSDNNYKSVSARHILINAVDEDEDGSYSEAELNAAHEAILAIYAEWQAGDETEESFAALAEEKSEDGGSNTNGGLYEHISKGGFVEEFDEFIYDPARRSGDTAIVYGESSSYTGYHLVYFVGEDDGTYAQYLADYGAGSSSGAQGLRYEEYSAWLEALEAQFAPKTNGFILWFAKV